MSEPDPWQLGREYDDPDSPWAGIEVGERYGPARSRPQLPASVPHNTL